MWALNEQESMDTSDTPWSWYYLADCGTWHQFEDDPRRPIRCENIEKSYLHYLQNNTNTMEEIDFSEMVQTDLTTRRQRRIQRNYNLKKSCSCFCAMPASWENFDPTAPYQMIRLSEQTPEYHTVAHFVREDGLLNKSIVSICRIQNVDLWQMYCSKRTQLMRIKGTKEIAERCLFHGTDTKNVDSICKYNFDSRMPARTGRVFGNGMYFATHASYAATYSTNSTANGKSKFLFLARVMVGVFKLGEKDLLKPDDNNIYDSCVDHINYPTVFIIFDSNQIYPEYLIEYN